MPFAALSMFHAASVLFAAAAAVAAFNLVPDAGVNEAAFVGLCVLLLGVTLAEGAARRMERRTLMERIDLERREREAQYRTVAMLTSEIETLQQSRDKGELVAEMRLVRSQLSRLKERAEETGRPAAIPLPAPAPPLTGQLLLEATTEALRENRIDLYLQPVVRLPQRRTVFHECLTRLRDGADRIITPDQYMPIAEDRGLVNAIDNLSLFRCVQTLKTRRGPDMAGIGFFCNLSPATLDDDEFFDQFTEFLAGNRDLADRIVFEIEAARLLDAGGRMQANLDALRRLGFRLSADHVTSLDMDLNEIAARGVAFMKIDAGPLIGDASMSAGAVRERLQAARTTLIASMVESEDQVVELVDAEIGLAQGYLFGEPRPMRPDA
ncbi:MAG: hypothetical protein TEF_02145 [Rhizobiales bacterium NRL2]|jgi:cyclic-di-GMP phosphodiesterase TipF (flagellum assembly factor)|nr:MAG: hypothetical protein TEF_02145 [Rhizobiales bacterium NRL2]